jgi:hypothetical protein
VFGKKRRLNLVKEVGTPRAGKLETADLEAKVGRLELEAREFEARSRLIEARSHFEKLRAQHPTKSGKKPD